MDKSQSRSSTQQRILILGVGELGLPIVEAFASYGQQKTDSKDQQFQLTVARSASTKQAELNEHLTSLGARVIHKDIVGLSEKELTDLFSYYDTIVGCSGYGSALNVQLKLAKAFIASSAKTYLPWQYGMDYDAVGRGSGQELFDEQLAVRDVLREKIGDATKSGEQSIAAANTANKRWVIISTGMFSSFIVLPVFGVITSPGGNGQDYVVRTLNTENTKVTLTSVEDIAKCVVHVVLVEPSLLGVVFVASDTLTYGEVAKALETATQKPVATKAWPMDQLEAELAKKVDAGKGDEALMEKYRVVFGRGIGASWPMETTLNHKAGIKMTGFTDWLKEKWLPTQSQSA